MDWEGFETALFESARDALERLLAEGHGPLYAAAFNGVYRETGRIIDLPHLGANSLKELGEDDGEGFHGVKWSPADWCWNWPPDEWGGAALMAFDKPLQAHANRAGAKEWHAAEKQFMTAVTRAAKRLAKHFAKDGRVEPDFIAFFHDEEGGVALARKTIPPALFLKHFPEQDAVEMLRRGLAAKPVAEQAEYYASCLTPHRPPGNDIGREEAEAWLIGHGEASTRALLAILKRNTWAVARVLGLIGVPDPVVIEALRAAMLKSKDEPGRSWCASALGYLGDHDWLLDQKDPKLVSAGITASLRAFRDKGALPYRLDYRPVEACLARYPESAPLIEAEIRPGSSFCTIKPEDFPEALRGLASPHVAIRRHAVCVVNDRYLPKKRVIAEIVPALRSLVEDPDEKMRYLVGLVFKEFKVTP